MSNDPVKLLLDEIEAFLSETGMRASTFGLRAVDDGKLITRLRAGGDVQLRKAAQIRSFMAAQRRMEARRAA